MAGQAHWLALLPLFLVAAMIGVLWWREVLQKRTHPEEVRTLRCPVSLHRVTATLVREGTTGAVLGVSRCDGFADPERVTCAKPCVALFKKPAVAA